MNVICVVLDRLPAGFLGCYGNTWVDTPTLDWLASESLTLDLALVESLSLEENYRSFWRGMPCFARHGSDSFDDLLPQVLRKAGWCTSLITDDADVAQSADAESFDRRIWVKSKRPECPASSPEETACASALAAVWEEWHSLRQPFFSWVHLGGLGTTWDAPYSYRVRYIEEEDPPPPTMIAVPSRPGWGPVDPDERLGMAAAYAGQVTLFDQLLEPLCSFWRDGTIEQRTLFMILGSRGLALGEHGGFGPGGDELREETLHIPWLLRYPGADTAATRSGDIICPTDLPLMVLNFLGIPARRFAAFGRDPLFTRTGAVRGRDRSLARAGNGEQGLRTAAWYARWPQSSTDAPLHAAELYAKPDDRWEVNNVADRCPEIVDALRAAARSMEEISSLDDLAPLPEKLTSQQFR